MIGKIFFGFIVDTFYVLRDKRDQKMDDEKIKFFMFNKGTFDISN